MFRNILYLLSAAALLLSCEKNTLQLPIDPVTSGARLKLVNAAPDFPGIELAINGKKFSAFTPSGATATLPGLAVGLPYNATFPNVGSNYAVVPTGAQSLSISAPATTTATSATAITSLNATFEDNKYYSLFVAGGGAQPEALLVNDAFEGTVDPSKLYVRFVNLVAGAATYDAVLTTTTPVTPLTANLAYKGVTAFIPIDAVAGPSFAVRLSGSATNVGTYQFTSSSSGRAITVFIRGVAGRTGTAAPLINGYVNR